MSFYYFPSDFVYWDRVPEHSKYKDKFYPVIQKMLKLVSDNHPFYSSKFSTGFGKNEYNAFLLDKNFINDVIFKAIFNMAKSHNKKNIFPIDFSSMYVKDIWWNFYEKGEYQEPHTHPGPEEESNGRTFKAAFSVVYVLKDENKDSRIIFHGNRLLPFYGENVNFDTSMLTTNQESDVMKPMCEGTIMVFPSSLAHMVKPSLESGRITIAANIYADIGA